MDLIGRNTGVSAPANRHFYMTAKLDNTRVNRDVQNYLQEIIQHLMAVDGSQVELKLDVEVVASKPFADSMGTSKMKQYNTKGHRRQKPKEVPLPEQDDTFFFIAGYTSGGAPYGVTWEEMGLEPCSFRSKTLSLLYAPAPGFCGCTSQ